MLSPCAEDVAHWPRAQGALGEEALWPSGALPWAALHSAVPEEGEFM